MLTGLPVANIGLVELAAQLGKFLVVHGLYDDRPAVLVDRGVSSVGPRRRIGPPAVSPGNFVAAVDGIDDNARGGGRVNRGTE